MPGTDIQISLKRGFVICIGKFTISRIQTKLLKSKSNLTQIQNSEHFSGCFLLCLMFWYLNKTCNIGLTKNCREELTLDYRHLISTEFDEILAEVSWHIYVR